MALFAPPTVRFTPLSTRALILPLNFGIFPWYYFRVSLIFPLVYQFFALLSLHRYLSPSSLLTKSRLSIRSICSMLCFVLVLLIYMPVSSPEFLRESYPISPLLASSILDRLSVLPSCSPSNTSPSFFRFSKPLMFSFTLSTLLSRLFWVRRFCPALPFQFPDPRPLPNRFSLLFSPSQPHSTFYASSDPLPTSPQPHFYPLNAGILSSISVPSSTSSPLQAPPKLVSVMRSPTFPAVFISRYALGSQTLYPSVTD